MRPATAAPLRAGMIGLDTSHAPEFTRIFNKSQTNSETGGIRVVAGFPGGSDLPASRDRVGKFTEELRGMGVEIVDSIPRLLERVDVVLLESVDGRTHLREAIPVIKAGKPLFIDKPVAGSLAEAIAIYDLARRHHVPCFSSSSLRYSLGLQEILADKQLGAVAGAATWGPCPYEEGTPDLFFYGIHGVEPLFTIMGQGCEKVMRVQTENTDLVTGVWRSGRLGTYRGIRRNKSDFGATVFGERAILKSGSAGGYDELCREIARFFKTGTPPVSAGETLEIFAFMEAADLSKLHGGAPVPLAGVIEKAKVEGARLME